MSSPINKGSGVYVIVPSAFTVTVPLAGSVTEPVVIVNTSPFGSKSFDKTEIVIGVPTSVITASLFATTLLLVSVGFCSTLIVTIAVSHACGVPLSHTVYVNESVPTKSVFGV